eukprot:scaffold4002_cov85-Cylindrotheca_fusiformis.AAC.6
MWLFPLPMARGVPYLTRCIRQIKKKIVEKTLLSLPDDSLPYLRGASRHLCLCLTPSTLFASAACNFLEAQAANPSIHPIDLREVPGVLFRDIYPSITHSLHLQF